MGDPNARMRPPFELDNRNKRSVAVDLRTADGHAFALKMIERADVFVTSLRLDALDADEARLRDAGRAKPAPDLRVDQRLWASRTRSRSARV